MNFTYDGIRKDWVLATRIKRPYRANRRLNIVQVSGYPGGYLESTETDPLIIPVRIEVSGEDQEAYFDNAEELVSWFDVDEPKPLIFDDRTNRVYYAIVEGSLIPDEIVQVGYVDVLFVCLDPYKHSTFSNVLTFPADTVIVKNKGTAEADPIFELTARKKTTFAMISNGDDESAEYNLIGRPVDVDEVVVDTKTQLLEERGQTLDTWSTAGTKVDGGVVAGSLSTDNDGITVPSYGADTNNWHGPALMKEVTPAQDFEVEMMVQGRTTTTNQTFRIEVYLFDENMKQLGKMAILDNSIGINRKKAEGRLGAYDGLGERYLISSQNYNYIQDYWYGMLRMRRIGTVINFYVTRINNSNRHVQSLSESTYINEDYLGKLKFIQIHIGKYGDTDRAYAPKIDHVKVFELAQVTEDQTPYILDVGDKVEFNHKEDDILINGEPRNDLKNFGGSFFKLAKGENMLMVTPEDSFDTKVTFRDKYL